MAEGPVDMGSSSTIGDRAATKYLQTVDDITSDLNLSVFIDKTIIDIMAHPVPEKLKIIIDINMNLAAGLRGSPAE